MTNPVDPMPDGYAAKIKPPEIEKAGTLQQWETLYGAILTQLENLLTKGKAQLAYKKIPLLMDMAQNYTTNAQNVEVSDKSNFDNTIGQYINAIQEDFDQYSGGTKSPPSKDYEGDADYAKQMIQQLMSNPDYKDFADALGTDVTSQLDAMFAAPSGDSVTTWWENLWTLPQPSTSSSSTAYTGTSPVSNAINAARNDVESQNTILNSQMQTYSKDASKDLAFEQDCYRAEIDMFKAPVTAAQSAAS